MIEKKYKIEQLFPYPLLHTNIGRKLTESELNFVESNKSSAYKNAGNTTSQDSYILNHSLSDIKQFINESLEIFKNKIICPRFELDLYITQSWLNWTEKNQFHHPHKHSNSFLSGVFYINAVNDRINISSPKNNNIQITAKEINVFNRNNQSIPVNTGDLIIFPSELYHRVNTVKDEQCRTSLAFNVFFKGSVGMTSKLTKLIL